MKIAHLILATALASAFALPNLTEVHAQAASPSAAKPAVKQRTYASPEEASAALAAAVRAKSVDDLLAVVGPGASSWLLSGDLVADSNDWKKFLAGYDEKNSLRKDGDKAVLEVGADDWPFPAPIVKRAGKWSFDGAAGREEILNRRVGRNELDAIQTLLPIVDAKPAGTARRGRGERGLRQAEERQAAALPRLPVPHPHRAGQGRARRRVRVPGG